MSNASAQQLDQRQFDLRLLTQRGGNDARASFLPGRHRLNAGVLRIVGDYTNAGSILKMNLKGATAGSGFDQLQVTGSAMLDRDALDPDTACGYAPTTATKLKMLTAGQRSGVLTLRTPRCRTGASGTQSTTPAT